jgi:hypothetical protein
MVALLLPRSYSELSERRDWFALRKRLLLLAKNGRGAPDTDTEPVSSVKTENELRKDRKPLESCSVADPDPGSGAFLTPGPGSGIWNKPIPDPGSRTSDPGPRIPDPQHIFFRAYRQIFG